MAVSLKKISEQVIVITGATSGVAPHARRHSAERSSSSPPATSPR
jgi:NADP-dependent 3-hydroxy acid dehydrogenase YdfG